MSFSRKSHLRNPQALPEAPKFKHILAYAHRILNNVFLFFDRADNAAVTRGV